MIFDTSEKSKYSLSDTSRILSDMATILSTWENGDF